ncbi:aldo/keto reductase [bacterium]|nr:aldo/keto reductase [bacterium]
MKSLTDCYYLTNGVGLPCIGYGSWRTPAGNICVEGVKAALAVGYRHIDTAAAYENEESVGEGILLSGVARKDIFLTSKLWNSDHGRDNTRRAFELSLKKLGADYLDLYLIHWPIAFAFRDSYPREMLESWHVLEELYREGQIKAIGVSNFLVSHLETLKTEQEIAPMVNQIELHVGYKQQDTVDYCKEKGIVLEAWSPICKGKAFDEPLLKAVAARHNKTGAQALIRWCLQKGYAPLPKSVTPSRILENADVFDFTLDEEDMRQLDMIDSVGRLGSHPDSCSF